ncbi:MAG: hypothetical protein K8H88_17130 [Sandaracinaceae bacterium]|nr:hypothetical protein [Sandaracinaceae bacterium]
MTRSTNRSHDVTDPLARPWRCPSCQLLLGVQRGEVIEVRYKDARYVVRGAVAAICRRCGLACERKTS